MSEKFDIPFKSKVVPAVLEEGARIRFRCHKEISCFNACCRNADITLTPYDVIRLKQRLGLGSAEVLREHSLPFEMDNHGLPGIKMKTSDSGACLFMREGEGCSVYEDRPTACRYYPIAMLAMKPSDEPTERHAYSLVREAHCKGHEESAEQTVEEYRRAQGVAEYDEINRDFYQLILKKKSTGPAVGRPSETSLQLFFMACYDIDRFKTFALSPSFRASYKLDPSVFEQIEIDDTFALQFSMAFLKQVLFGEKTIAEQEGAWEKRVAERKEIWELRRQAEIARAEQKKEELMREVES
ncbi:MAG: YkgJ family cysteine cluster protein [Gammaproteobacteria bacterium]|nr:YkgJ family cysteine cluster protein [Gammaproteobacteria bacterium]MBU1656332.1 YkgJ family cysteine cluster protein [Gammaproteobacteria bacterium]MBU1959897.1 YkgJ family cysteine cluster protein [Gammaproteobacteria bacterium]